MADELIIKAFESVGIPKMQTTVYLDLLKNKEYLLQHKFLKEQECIELMYMIH